MDQPEAFGAEREIPLKMAPFTLACAAKGFPFIVASYSGDSIVFLRTAGPQSLWEVPTLRHSSWKSWTAFPCSNTNVCAGGSVEGALSDPGSAKDGVAPPCSAHCYCPLLRVYGRDYGQLKARWLG